MKCEGRPVTTKRPVRLAWAALCIAMLAGCSMSEPPQATASTAPTAPSSGQMTLDTPVGTIAADPRGKAILDRDVPGLTTNPNYPMIKMMTLPALQTMSGGQMTQAQVNHVKADLAQTPPAGTP